MAGESAPERIYISEANGHVIMMDLPLHESIQSRLDKGQLQRVNEDGSSYVEPAPAKSTGRR